MNSFVAMNCIWFVLFLFVNIIWYRRMNKAKIIESGDGDNEEETTNKIDNLNRRVEIEKSNREFYENKYYKLLDENTDLKNKITDLESKIEDLDKKIEIYDSYPSPLLSEEDKLKMYCDLKIAELEKKYSWLANVITLQSYAQLYDNNTHQQLVNSGMYQRILTF